MDTFPQVVKQDASLKGLMYECDDPLDPEAEFFLCDSLEDLDRYLSNGACIFPVSSHHTPVEALAACIDEGCQMDEEVEEMILDDEMELRTFSHLGQADTLAVSRSACAFHGKPSGAEFSCRTSPIGKALIVVRKNLESSEAAGSANPQMEVVDCFQAELKDVIRRIRRLQDREADEGS